jgi:hypothetical protein
VARVERQTSPRSRPGQAAGTIAPTLIAPRLGPRRNINPAARRRTTALFALVLSILFGMIAGAIVLAGPAKVSVPDLQGFTWERAATRVQQAGLRVAFVSRFDQARRGTAIAQEPRPGTKADRGTQVQIVLSAGPLPVRVPRVEGENSQDARRVLSSLGLQVRIAAVPAPGVVPGTVTQQTPGAAAELAPGSTVKLSVAETPQWRAITSFSGQGSGQSVPFRIRGPRWRLVYNMHYDGTCALLFICSGPSAQVAALAGTWSGTRFDLNDGANQTREFDTGAGRYQLSVSPGSDTASWSITVEDYF